jgi:sulfur relay protein TusB/DsrH
MTEVFDIVYLFGFSLRYGNEINRLTPVLKTHKKHGLKIGIILIHDGVIGIDKNGKIPTILDELKGISVYATLPDLAARGILIDSLLEEIKPIEYSALVDILDNSQRIISWM